MLDSSTYDQNQIFEIQNSLGREAVLLFDSFPDALKDPSNRDKLETSVTAAAINYAKELMALPTSMKKHIQVISLSRGYVEAKYGNDKNFTIIRYLAGVFDQRVLSELLINTSDTPLDPGEDIIIQGVSRKVALKLHAVGSER